MADWDLIVVGAGSNGLVLAGELAARGLRVLALEARLEAGGLLATEECTLPGFWHNVLSPFQNAFAETPPYALLDLARESAHFAVPPVQAALLVRDGPPLVFHTDVDATCRSLAASSMHDARVYHEWYAGAEPRLVESLLRSVYAPPPANGAAGEAGPTNAPWTFGALPKPLERFAALSPREVVEDLFQSLEVRAAVLQQLVVPWGILPDYPGMGAAALLALTGATPFAVALGGAHLTAQALIRALVRRGGRYQVLKPVARILAQAGAVTGVELVDGTRLRAPVVASSVGLQQTFIDLLGSNALSAELTARLHGFELDEFALFGVHLALARAPRYDDAANGSEDPADEALRVFLGGETPDELDALWDEIRSGRLPEPRGLLVSVPTRFDARQAPAGQHTAVLLQPVPYAPGGSPDAWEELREPYADRCVEAWRHHARNLADADILARAALAPRDVAARYGHLARGALGLGRMTADQAGASRPLPELAQYRTPIRGLYLCGTCMYPGPGWLGAAGHNAAQVILEDLGRAD